MLGQLVWVQISKFKRRHKKNRFFKVMFEVILKISQFKFKIKLFKMNNKILLF